jgi:hypothetical protein
MKIYNITLIHASLFLDDAAKNARNAVIERQNIKPFPQEESPNLPPSPRYFLHKSAPNRD